MTSIEEIMVNNDSLQDETLTREANRPWHPESYSEFEQVLEKLPMSRTADLSTRHILYDYIMTTVQNVDADLKRYHLTHPADSYAVDWRIAEHVSIVAYRRRRCGDSIVEVAA
jgi:hypothetical protein